MNRTTQQIPSNPALDFANAILEETNGALELIEILHDIAQGNDEDATAHDRITATRVLMDRGLGKCPRQISHNVEPNPDPDDNDVEPAPYSIRGALREAPALRESPPATPTDGPQSPRRVTQIDDSLNQSLGPAPGAHIPTTKDVEPAPYSIRGAIRESPEHENADSPDSFDTSSIQYVIQQHILTITNNGQTLRDTLKEIARAKDDPRFKPIHRTRAARILLDRILGANPTLIQNGVCPECRQRWTTHPDSHAHPERGHVANPVLLDDDEIEAAKPETWDKVIAELKRLEDEGARTPGPPGPEIDYSAYMPPDDFDLTPYLEQAEAFKAKVALRIERQKNWPKIEERRRKKLAQIYPSHSDDQNDSPDT